jgi:hypothetical protein
MGISSKNLVREVVKKYKKKIPNLGCVGIERM